MKTSKEEEAAAKAAAELWLTEGVQVAEVALGPLERLK